MSRETDDELPRPPRHFLPPVLDRWDVAELRAYIATLKAEIARAEAAIGKLDAHRSAADAFFRKP
jgi:uncharacterized small protein (DUF1192 family)